MKEELKKEQIKRLAIFMLDEYQYSLFPNEGRCGFEKLDKEHQTAWLDVAKIVIEDFEF